MAPNPSFKALQFLSHMDLKKEVRKNSFSNPALSLSFLQNKFINLCKQSLWPQVLRNISFFFQKLPHLPSSKQPRETWPTPPFWRSQKNLLASQDSCPASFFTINNLHVLNGVSLERSATSVPNCFFIQLSHFCLLIFWARSSAELLVLSYYFLSRGKNLKHSNAFLKYKLPSHLNFVPAVKASWVPMWTIPSKHLSLFCSPYE